MSKNTTAELLQIANIALVLVEVQRDLAVLNRKYIELTENFIKLDNIVGTNFRQFSTVLNKCVAYVNKQEGAEGNATNTQGPEGNGVDEENLRRKESEERILCDDQRGETEGGGGQETQIPQEEDII